MKNFFILSLPRSRTAWLSALLTTDKSLCLHEGFNLADGREAYVSMMKSSPYHYAGDANSAWVLHYELLRPEFPGARCAIVLRDPAEVAASFSVFTRVGPAEAEALRQAYALLIDLSCHHPVFRFEDLDDPDEVRRMVAHLMPGVAFDRDRFELFKTLNIQRRELRSDFYGYAALCGKQCQAMGR